MKAIIIDDEKPARDNLKAILKKIFDNIEVVAEADSVESGIKVLTSTKTDVVFLDINLFDGSGFNILEGLETINFHVIFITAYNDFAIRAFRVNALDYLLKPIDIEELQESINKVRKLDKKFKNDSLQETIENLKRKNQNTKLAINESDGVRFVRIQEIIRCQSDNNYTEVHMYSGEIITSSKTLKFFNEVLDKFGFFRIHQSHLVNLKNVKKILKRDGLQVELENGDILDVSRRKKEGLYQEMVAFQSLFS